MSMRPRGAAQLLTSGNASLRPRPVADLRGLDRRRRAAQHDRPRAARRRARLPPLLGRRAPRRPDARRPQPRGADRPDRRRHRGDPGRQRRRDAAPLQPAQGRRDVHDPRRAVPGPDRPRDRPGGGHRPADHVRAPARPPPGRARRLPPAAGRAARLPRRLRFRPTTPSTASRRPCPAAPSFPSPGCSAPRRRARSGPLELGLPYAFADFINAEGADIARLYRERFEPSRDLQAPRTAVAVWVLVRAHRRGGRATCPRAAA